MAHLEPSMIRGTTSTPWVTANNETQLLELGACSLCLLYANIDVESPPFVDHFPRKPWASTLVYPRVNIYILENLVEKKNVVSSLEMFPQISGWLESYQFYRYKIIYTSLGIMVDDRCAGNF